MHKIHELVHTDKYLMIFNGQILMLMYRYVIKTLLNYLARY